MAASSQPTVMCPVCSDYEGPVSSVEAHISASEGDHEGTVGTDHRDELEAQVEEGSDMVTPEEYEEQREQLDEPADTEAETTPEGEAEGPKPSPSGDVATSAGVAAAGAPVGLSMVSEVDTRYLLVGALAVVAVVYLLTTSESSDDNQSAESPEEGEEFDPFAAEVSG